MELVLRACSRLLMDPSVAGLHIQSQRLIELNQLMHAAM